MEPHRVCEILFGEFSGSGYLVSSRLALTARHVFDPKPRKGLDCQVWPLSRRGDRDKRLQDRKRPNPIPARVAWISKRQDLAAIEVLEPAAEIGLATIPFGTLRDDGQSYPYIGAGLPEAAGGYDRGIEGTVRWVQLPGLFDVDVANGAPEPEKWVGLSGGPILVRGHLVAVVKQVPTAFRGGVVQATPVQYLLEDDDFLTRCDELGIARPKRMDITRIGAPLLERISASLYLIDRKNAVAAIVEHVRGLAGQTGPQVVMVECREDDLCEDLILQLCEHPELQRRLGREAAPGEVIVPLPWPNEMEEINPDYHAHELRQALTKAAMLPDAAVKAPTLAKQLRKSFDDGSTPCAFWTLIRRGIAYGGQGKLLQHLLALWESMGKGTRPTLLLLCLAWDEAKPRTEVRFGVFRRDILPDLELVREVVEAQTRLERRLCYARLEKVDQRHIRDWIGDLRLRCRPQLPGELEMVEVLLNARVGDGKTMREIHAAVAAVATFLRGNPVP